MPDVAVRPARQKKTQESHKTWIQAFDTEGPFISVPVAKKTWGEVVPRLSAQAHDQFRLRFSDFVGAYDALDSARLRAQSGLSQDIERFETHQSEFRDVQTEWISFILRDLAKWGDRLDRLPASGQGYVASNPNGTVSTAASGRLLRDGAAHALVLSVAPTENLRQDGKDGWSANVIDRMGEMLRTAEISCGIVTDGRWWSIVWTDTRAEVTRISTIGSGIVDALNWGSDLLARDAYINLIGLKSLSGADETARLGALVGDSLLDAEQITEALGTQVRSAVELLVQAFSESSLSAQSRGLPDPLPEDSHQIYEAAVTVMMRVVFLLFAEERGLMPVGEMYRTSYSVAGLLDELDERKRHDGDESLERSEVWYRLLAVSAALYEGASFDDIRMPAYGGSLFDPTRFPWVEGHDASGLALKVNDRVMLEVLRSVQFAETGTGRGRTRQRLSFRDIDVEQIGYIYEGLIGYTCTRTTPGQIVLGIVGAPGLEPEITLDEINLLCEEADYDGTILAGLLRDFWKKDQPSAKPLSLSSLEKLLNKEDALAKATAVRQLASVIHDGEKLGEIGEWATILRPDLRGLPVVIPEGGLVVQETKSRANSGAHYTPRSLAEEVVLHALQPLCYAPGPLQTADSSAWQLKSSTEILNLRVADIAVGSGAFLVAAARYLGERLLEAWQQESGSVNRKSGRDLNLAIREVVSQCLYGADINGMAVEMCKLSLWLVSLDPKKPFSFVDDKVLHGNSLLGLTEAKQLRGLHIKPSTRRLANTGFTVDVDEPLRRAAAIRAKLATPIADQAELDPQRSAKHKKALLAESRIVTNHLRTIADGVVAAGLRLGGKPGNALDEAYEKLSFALLKAYPESGLGADSTMLDSMTDKGLTPTVETDDKRWQPLHWIVEVPDVMIGRGGFDAVIGNPPFLAGKKMTPAMGGNVRQFVTAAVAEHRLGNSDLCGYFFLRSVQLLKPNGMFGLLGTNSVGQGDTRSVALQPLLDQGVTFIRTWRSRKWPVSSASLEYSTLWGTNGDIEPAALTIAEGVSAPITAALTAQGRVFGPPSKLMESAGKAFVGSNVNGLGFQVPSEIAHRMIENDPRNRDVLYPFLRGTDLNSSPVQRGGTWIVYFRDWAISQAQIYQEPFEWILNNVKPERQLLLNKPQLVKRWWMYESSAKSLYELIQDKVNVVVLTRASKTMIPQMVMANQIFNEGIVVFNYDTFAALAFFSGAPHLHWFLEYGTSRTSDPRYSTRHVLEKFPIPNFSADLEMAGRELHEKRSALMVKRDLGLTDIYNFLNNSNIKLDSDLREIRDIHDRIDSLTLECYGWGDIALDHGFNEYKKVERWTVGPTARQEILDRLLEENHRRAKNQTANAVSERSRRATGARRVSKRDDITKEMF